MSIPASSRGISLLEVLVALTIFSIGAIGLSGWMTLAARATHAGYLRTQASFLAGDMAKAEALGRLPVPHPNPL